MGKEASHVTTFVDFVKNQLAVRCRLSAAHGVSPPVVQDDALICRRHSGGRQITNGPRDVGRFHIPGWVIILPNKQDAGMMALAREEQFMKCLEVFVVV